MKITDITKTEIENMLYLIGTHADKIEARRFNGLSLDKKQKVAFILKKRAKRARNHEQPFDKYIVREVIDDANRDCFIFDENLDELDVY